MAVPHPIPYQGSKRNLASIIINYLPDDTDRLIEPFAGSAAITLAAAYYHRAQRFVLNDINAPLMELWRALIFEPDALANRYERLWFAQFGCERRFYDLVRQRFNKSHRPYYFLYLLARCVKAAVRYNTDGEFNQSPDNRRKGRRPEAMRKDIQSTSYLLREKAVLTSVDYRVTLQDATPSDVIYMDPPYQGVSGQRDRRYLQGILLEDFVQTLSKLNGRNISYIVSYDGRTGSKVFGVVLPDYLELTRVEVEVGRSSQSTLLGRVEKTYESLYLSPALLMRLNTSQFVRNQLLEQAPLFGDLA
jgi:DNA adenine methylase